MLKVKRVYEPHGPTDGARFLVDRLWPRGMRKEHLHLDGWLKDVAPSDSLRKWFRHDPAKWDEFKSRYFAELGKNPKAFQSLMDAAGRGNVTLIFSAHDTMHNNALALKEYLEERLAEQGEEV